MRELEGGLTVLRLWVSQFSVLCILLASFQAQAVTHFGFFADAMRGVGEGNYIAETAAISNVHFISDSFASGREPGWRQKVLEAQSQNNKVILILESFLFDWRQLTLNERRHQALRDLRDQLTGLEDSILGVYLTDEPFHRNQMNANHPTRLLLSRSQVFDNLQEAALLAKQFFPQAKTLITEAHPAIDQDFWLPAAIDWVGVNCYLNFGSVCSLENIKRLNDLVYSRLLFHQRMVFTLDGFWRATETPALSVQESLVERNNEILKLIAQSYQDKTVAFFPFLYQSHLNGERLLGTRDMPLVKNYLFEMGGRIKQGAWSSGCGPVSGACEGKDYGERDPILELPWQSQQVKGDINQVDEKVIRGWACVEAYPRPIEVHIYAGASAGQPGAQYVGRAWADRESEEAVLRACGVNSGSYRYVFSMNPTLLRRFAGEPIYVHGIHPGGGRNSLVSRSGTWSLPRPQ